MKEEVTEEHSYSNGSYNGYTSCSSDAESFSLPGSPAAEDSLSFSPFIVKDEPLDSVCSPSSYPPLLPSPPPLYSSIGGSSINSIGATGSTNTGTVLSSSPLLRPTVEASCTSPSGSTLLRTTTTTTKTSNLRVVQPNTTNKKL